MSRKFIWIALAIIIGIGAIAAGILLSGSSFIGEDPTPEPVPASSVQQPRVVSAEAFVVPIRESNLSFEVAGRIASLEVDEGGKIEEGQVLAKLDDSTQQTRLAEAEANVLQAEARVTTANRQVAEAEADLAAAVAGLAESEANLARVQADPTIEQIAQLQASLARAEAALAELLVGATPEEIAEAEARVRTSQAQLNEVLAGARDEDIKAASARVLQTEADVRSAQTDYDKVRYGDPADVLTAGTTLEKATLEYEAARAEYERLVNGASDEEIATAQAGVSEAQAGLNTLRAGATAEQIGQAQADVVRAEADLANLLAGSTAEEIAQAEAQADIQNANVEKARVAIERQQAVLAENRAGQTASEAQLASAQVDLDKTVLEAPFVGEVGSLNNMNEGEYVQGGSNVVSVGDTGVWQIETDDLTEIDIVDVQVGAHVDISVDALPGEVFEGKVIRVTPRSITKAGDVTYTVLIEITKGNMTRLLWGMTTFVDIEADSGLAE